jgi:ABC-type nitrate/sulfonate/bicarbonate transport system permease component
MISSLNSLRRQGLVRASVKAPKVVEFLLGFILPFFKRFGLFFGLLFVWELALWNRDVFHVKAPSAILATMIKTWFSGSAYSAFLTDDFFRDVVPTLTRAFSGWVVGGALGAGFGLAIGISDRVRVFTSATMEFLRSVPQAAVVPTFIIVFGPNDATRIAAISFSTIWVVLLNTAQGVRAIDPVMLDAAQVLRLSTMQRLLKVILPAALPQIFAGLRITISLSLIVALITEWILTDSGLGFYLIERQRNYDVTEMWAALALLGLIGLLSNTAFLHAERAILGWHHEMTKMDGRA